MAVRGEEMNAKRRFAVAGIALALAGCGIAAPGTNQRGTSWSRHEGMTAAPHVIGVGTGVLVGFGGDEPGLDAFRSTDGISWAAVAAMDPLDHASVMDIGTRTGEGGDAFVAVGSWTQDPYGRAAAWVTDGNQGWKRAPDGPELANASGSGGTQMVAVAWGQTRWVAGGVEWNESGGQDGAIWTSPDGLSWSRVTLPDPGMGIADLIAGGPGFVAVGSSESGEGDAMGGAHSGIWTSVDGTIWTRVPDGPIFANGLIQRVVPGGPGLVAIGYTIDLLDANGVFSPAIWTSADGLAWSREAAPADPDSWTVVEGTLQGRVMGGIVATPQGFVAVGVEFGLTSTNYHRAAVWTSTDGRSWARVPHDPVFDGGEDSGARFGMRGVYLIGDRLIATGVTPSGPTIWVSPPEAGRLPGQTGPGATPGGPVVPRPSSEPGPTGQSGFATPAPTMPYEMALAEFTDRLCTTLDAVERALGNAAGAESPEAAAFGAALEAKDPAAILATLGPIREHLTSASREIGESVPFEPGDEPRALLEPFLRLLLANLGDIEREAQAGSAPAAGTAAFLDAEGERQFARIIEAARQVIGDSPESPGSPAC